MLHTCMHDTVHAQVHAKGMLKTAHALHAHAACCAAGRLGVCTLHAFYMWLLLTISGDMEDDEESTSHLY